MPATARRLNSAESKGSRKEIREKWLVTGASDRPDARAALEAELTASIGALVLKDYGVDEAQSPGVYPAFAVYSEAGKIQDNKPLVDPPEVGDEVISFSSVGGSERIYAAYATRAYGEGSSTPPDCKGLIGATKDGVSGVDVERAQVSFSLRTAIAAADWTEEYRNRLTSLTDHVNNAPYKGYQEGEVLFRGASSTQRNGGDVELELFFRVSFNAGLISVGDVGVIYKYGWEYLDVLTEQWVSGEPPRVVRRPVAAYVHEVYPWADFADLMPTPPGP